MRHEAGMAQRVFAMRRAEYILRSGRFDNEPIEVSRKGCAIKVDGKRCGRKVEARYRQFIGNPVGLCAKHRQMYTEHLRVLRRIMEIPNRG